MCFIVWTICPFYSYRVLHLTLFNASCIRVCFVWGFTCSFFSCLLYLHFALLYSSVLPESLFGGSSRGAYTRIRLTGVWSSSVGNGHPLWPSEQLQEGHRWGGEGGWGHAPAQPDQLSQPCGHWGGSCCNQIALTSSESFDPRLVVSFSWIV